MPRTASKRRPKGPEKDPIDIYRELEYHKQLICWNYYRFKVTDGEEGWNPTEAGSIYHQRSSVYLLSLGSGSWFRHIGRQMATLAEKFAQLNQIPSAPASNNTDEVDQEQLTPTTPSSSSPSPSTIAMNRKKAPPSSPVFSPTRSGIPVTPRNNIPNTTNSAVARDSKVVFMDKDLHSFPPLSLPIAFGNYESFDYTSRTSIERVMVRILVHNAVELQDVEYDWVTPRILMLRIAWPEWFVFAEQMAAFATDEDGEVLFPPDHAMTQSMARRNWEMADKSTSRVYDEGFIKFDKDMRQDSFEIERLNIDIPSKGTTVRGIQFFVQ